MPSEAFAHLARRFEGEDFQGAEHSFRLCRKMQEFFLAAPKRSSAATIMLVQTSPSPTSEMRLAIFPRGYRTRSDTMLVSSR